MHRRDLLNSVGSITYKLQNSAFVLARALNLAKIEYHVGFAGSVGY